jgi:hypothetical protein
MFIFTLSLRRIFLDLLDLSLTGQAGDAWWNAPSAFPQ